MDSSVLTSQLVLAYIAAHGLQFLKGKDWFPLMKRDSVKLNRAFSALVAFCVSMGMQYTFSSHVGTIGQHMLDIQIVIPSIAVLGHNVWAWISQFILQDAVFKGFIQGKEKAA